MAHAASCGAPRLCALELADVVREHGDALRAAYPVTAQQEAVLRAIVRCRTASLGGHLESCPACGLERPVYNSCRDRHCPKCQGPAADKWISQRELRLLDTNHFHCVFTLPAELRPLARFAPRAVYDALFACAAATLQQMARDPRHLGGELAITLVLHTWNRQLDFHPHVHCIVSGGGLSLDGRSWVPSRSRGFLFSKQAMGRLLRGKMLAALNAAQRRGAFNGFAAFDDPEGFDRFMQKLARARKSWIVYVKRAFHKAEHVLRYLGRYTHRVAIANSRLVAMTGDQIIFQAKARTVTLDAVEFLRRFTLHVLPKRYTKIRHHGLLAPGNVNTKLAAAHRLLSPPRPPPPAAAPSACASTAESERLLSATTPRTCPSCGALMQLSPLPSPSADPARRSRAPP
jgi:hypothetical protein